jgi:hypothetical protein
VAKQRFEHAIALRDSRQETQDNLARVTQAAQP